MQEMTAVAPRNVFITGGTGYVGRHLVPRLVERGHSVTALVREGARRELPRGARIVKGDALDRASFEDSVPPADCFIQLVGVPHPSPLKARQFRQIDLVSAEQSIMAAQRAGVEHFVYISVAQPAPVMKAFQAVRGEVERMLVESEMNCTILRPWYILGPGHWWPYTLAPLYGVLRMIPATRETALRLGLIDIRTLVDALIFAVENPATGVRILTVPEMRRNRRRG